MNCRETRKWMSPYLDSELGSTKTFEVSEHLRACPECAARFDAERHVDEMVRDRLTQQREMPAAVWDSITRDISTPRWVRRIQMNRGRLALAACLLLAVLSTVWLRAGRTYAVRPWIIQELVAAAPQERPFAGGRRQGEQAVQLVAERFGVAFSMAEADQRSHQGFRLVQAVERNDANGRAFVELRLNCCGQPVLLVLAKPEDGLRGGPFDGLPDAAGTFASRSGRYHVGSMRTATLISVAASPHPVGHILAGLRPDGA